MKRENLPRLTDLTLLSGVDFAENTHFIHLLNNLGIIYKKKNNKNL